MSLCLSASSSSLSLSLSLSVPFFFCLTKYSPKTNGRLGRQRWKKTEMMEDVYEISHNCWGLSSFLQKMIDLIKMRRYPFCNPYPFFASFFFSESIWKRPDFCQKLLNVPYGWTEEKRTTAIYLFFFSFLFLLFYFVHFHFFRSEVQTSSLYFLTSPFNSIDFIIYLFLYFGAKESNWQKGFFSKIQSRIFPCYS